MAAMLVALPIGCAATKVVGTDAGCAAYAESRLAMPPFESIGSVPDAWALWVADLDDRMTGTCR